MTKQNEKTTKNILKEKTINILKSNIIFIIGTIILIYKAVFLNYMIGVEINRNMIIYSVFISIFLMCPTINTKKKFSYIFFLILYFVLNLIIYFNFIYEQYSNNLLSFYQIINFRYSREIGSGLVNLINIDNLLMFWWDYLLLFIILIDNYRKNNEKNIEHKKITKVIIIILIIVANIIIVKSKINDIYLFRKYNKSLAIQDISIYFYHYEDGKDFLYSIFSNEKINEEKIKESYMQNINEKQDITEFTGIAKDSNVLILQLESLDEFVINKKINGKEITPNLNKFFNENIYCSDMYNQGLGTTADSEFEMENSLYPLENGYVFQKYYNNRWNDIYSALKEKGYYTSFMHPNTSTYWNRKEVYNTGYNIDEYNDIEKFSNLENAGEFYSDEGFFKEAVNKISKYNMKFCTTLVSITTHIPFYLTGVSNIEEKTTLKEEDLNEFSDDMFARYLISCNFVDYAFGQYLEKLKENGLIDNSIIIVYGDHGAGLSCTEDIEKLYNINGKEYTEFEDKFKNSHIPFGIKIPNINKSIKISRAVSKIDIKPTIMDLLGIEENFSIGESIFTNKDYSFIKGLGFVTSKYYLLNEEYYTKDTCKKINIIDELKNLTIKMQNEIYLSDTIIKNNLLYEDKLFNIIYN